MNSQLAAAYAVCRHIARSAARNFYYGFLVLPRDKRDAVCAVYAFMRHSDDLTDDPVLLAAADTQRRFKIPLALFDRLVEGTAMDVPWQPGETLRYPTFEDL